MVVKFSNMASMPQGALVAKEVQSLCDFDSMYEQRCAAPMYGARGRFSQLLAYIWPNFLTHPSTRFCINENGNFQPCDKNPCEPSCSETENINLDSETTAPDDALSDPGNDTESSPLPYETDENDEDEGEIDITVDTIGGDGRLSYCQIFNSDDTFQFARCTESGEINEVTFPNVVTRTGYIPPRPVTTQEKRLANRLVQYAREYKMPIMEDLLCPDCMLIPKDPVTVLCGHTRCLECVEDNSQCRCGITHMNELHVNIAIRDLIEKMISHYNLLDFMLLKKPATDEALIHLPSHTFMNLSEYCDLMDTDNARFFTLSLESKSVITTSKGILIFSRKQIVVTTDDVFEARYNLAQRLIANGYYTGAVPHLAQVAASKTENAMSAYVILQYCITAITDTEEEERRHHYFKQHFRTLRNLSARTWLRKSDIECNVCTDYLSDPVTTFCGHTFCRNCLKRSLNYASYCPLCKQTMQDVDVYDINETYFINSLLESMDLENGPIVLEPGVMPIFINALTLPSVQCQILIVNPQYWKKIQRLLNANRPEIAMLSYCDVKDAKPTYGTILEIRDCVQLENGSYLLNTIGTWRFYVTHTEFKYGCNIAKVHRVVDNIPQDTKSILYVQALAVTVADKANRWLRSLDAKTLLPILTFYGTFPIMGDDYTNWWESDNGPYWLWWLIAILPVNIRLKILMLSTNSVTKRLEAVGVSLNKLPPACDQNSISHKKRNADVIWNEATQRRIKRVRRNP